MMVCDILFHTNLKLTFPFLLSISSIPFNSTSKVKHFLHIAPSQINLCSGAYAYVGGTTSFYKGARGLQTYLHELGHNIYLGHSGVAGYPGVLLEETYGDR
jgi:hypothetical protein